MKRSTSIFPVLSMYVDYDKRANDLVHSQSLYVPAPLLLRRTVQKSLHERAFYYQRSDTNIYLGCQLLGVDLTHKLFDQKIIPVEPELELIVEGENQYYQIQN